MTRKKNVGEVKALRSYSPAYFDRLGRFYQDTSKTAREFGHLVLLCNRLFDAGTQLRYAAQELRKQGKR